MMRDYIDNKIIDKDYRYINITCGVEIFFFKKRCTRFLLFA